MSAFRVFGTPVDARWLREQGLDDAYRARLGTRDTLALTVFLRDVVIHDAFLRSPKPGDTVGEWTCAATADGIEWARRDERVLVVNAQNERVSFFSPYPFSHGSVRYAMQPAHIGRGAYGAVYRAVADRPSFVPSFALKIQHCTQKQGDVFRNLLKEVNNVRILNENPRSFKDSVPAVQAITHRLGDVAVSVTLMEAADGDLVDYVMRRRPLRDDHALAIGRAIISEVQNLYACTEMLHCDLKLANLLYVLRSSSPDAFTVSIADYGSLTKIGERCTTSYASPLAVKDGGVSVPASWKQVALCLGLTMLECVGEVTTTRLFVPGTNAFWSRDTVRAGLDAFFDRRGMQGAFSITVARLLQWNGTDFYFDDAAFPNGDAVAAAFTERELSGARAPASQAAAQERPRSGGSCTR